MPVPSKRLMCNLRMIVLAICGIVLHSDVQAAGESPDQPREMVIGGAGIPVTLSSGKTLWFRAVVTPSKDSSHFRIETKGKSDTCLTLYRDLSSARADRALASDDDSGAGNNALIQFPLGYPGPFYVKLRTCGNVQGKITIASQRLFQEPGKCDSGGCVLALSLGEQPAEREMLTLLWRVRDLLSASPEGRRLSDLYWDLSGELWDDVVREPQFRGTLSAQLTLFLPALRSVAGNGGLRNDFLVTEDLIRQTEDLRALIDPRLSPELAARLDGEFNTFRAQARPGAPLRSVLSDLGLLEADTGGSWPEPQAQAILVKLKKDAGNRAELRSGRVSFGDPALDSLFRRYEAGGLASVFPFSEKASGFQRVYKITLEHRQDAERLLRELRSSRSVEYAEIDGTAYALSDDVYSRFQYGLMSPSAAAGGVDAVTAWAQTMGSPSILVAVVDTGVDYNHSDLVGRVRRDLGYDYADGDSDPMDDHGHGSHVAGIIAASINNGFAIAGVAPQVTILPFRVLGANGQGSFSSIAAGIEAAARAGARVINLSLGSSDESQVMEDALRFATERGTLVVAAAGNEGTEGVFYPARSQYAVAVSAVDRRGKLASFSSYGEDLDLAGPGVDVVSAWKNGDVCYASGTSMATPHVVGVAALVLSRRPTLTRDQLESVLKTTARDAGSPGYDTQYGSGIVDAARALRN
jgi:cell wall-associated protease